MKVLFVNGLQTYVQNDGTRDSDQPIKFQVVRAGVRFDLEASWSTHNGGQQQIFSDTIKKKLLQAIIYYDGQVNAFVVLNQQDYLVYVHTFIQCDK
jgi:hypothetical protein